jgi:hypothetical protein
LSVEDFGMLPAYHVYASLVRNNAVQPWASGITSPPPPKTSDPDGIRRLSRGHYGQPLAAIEAGFAELLSGADKADSADDMGAPKRRRRQA